MDAPTAAKPRKQEKRMSKKTDKSSQAPSSYFTERMPTEILIEILSYLDASTLFSISCVSKHLHRLASDNLLWRNIAKRNVPKMLKPKLKDMLLKKLFSFDVKDPTAGHWKWLYLRSLTEWDMAEWRVRLRHTSSHTGLPKLTEQFLGDLQISWELTLSDKSGHNSTHKLSQALFSETSVTLCWGKGCLLPNYQDISTLQLHGVRKVALNCPGPNRPCLRSLVVKLDMQTVTKSAGVIGQDRLVELRLLQPGVIFGIFEDQTSIAFVMFTFHLHMLVEKSTQGFPACPYVVPMFRPCSDDIDSEYGLHGYQLHLLLHDSKSNIMSEVFTQLFCRRDQICDGLIQLTAISRADLSQHKPLSGKISLPWKCEVLEGVVKNCCIMNVTLMDEFRNIFWCVSSPVSMTLEKTHVYYDYDGAHFLIHYGDSDGQVKMQLVWIEEQKRFLLVSLVVYVTVGKVNKHFGRDY